MSLETLVLPEAYGVLAPDESEIRILPVVKGGRMVHCALPPGVVTLAIRHRTVEELWYVIGGRGQVWRKDAEKEETVDLVLGVSANITLGTDFLFRSAPDQPLELILATMPPWPGPDEAVRVPDHWEPTVSG
jgi:mannose-6-phosphate isomerase-like protein (cupin superfamily)